MTVLTCHLSSTPEAAVEASELFLEAAHEWRLSEELRERILLVLGEAVANAAEHGNGLDPDKNIYLELARTRDEITVRVEHEGQGLSLEKLEEASLPEDAFDTGGRGLYIIRELTERVWLEADGRRMCLAWGTDPRADD